MVFYIISHQIATYRPFQQDVDVTKCDMIYFEVWYMIRVYMTDIK